MGMNEAIWQQLSSTTSITNIAGSQIFIGEALIGMWPVITITSSQLEDTAINHNSVQDYDATIIVEALNSTDRAKLSYAVRSAMDRQSWTFSDEYSSFEVVDCVLKDTSDSNTSQDGGNPDRSYFESEISFTLKGGYV